MKIRFIIFVLFGLFTCASYSQDLIKIGVRSYYPPFEMVLNQAKQVSGFEVDVVTAICKRLKLNCVFVPLQFSELFKAISTDKITLAIGGIIITHEREGNYLFSVPYLGSNGQFVIKADSSLDNTAALCSKRIGIVAGSVFRETVLLHCNNSAQIIEYPVIQDAYNGLSKESIDAVITDEKGAKYWVANNSGIYKLVGNPIPTGMGYGIMASLKENALMQEINKTLMAMQGDDSFLKIYNLYFGNEEFLKPSK